MESWMKSRQSSQGKYAQEFKVKIYKKILQIHTTRLIIPEYPVHKLACTTKWFHKPSNANIPKRIYPVDGGKLSVDLISSKIQIKRLSLYTIYDFIFKMSFYSRHINIAQKKIEKAKRSENIFSPRKRSEAKRTKKRSEANKANFFFKIETKLRLSIL